MKPLLTYEIAQAAATDTGNRQARGNGRTIWNFEDFSAACDELNRLTDLLPDGGILDCRPAADAPACPVTSYTRRLCYAHHCQEFDKLSNIYRAEAAHWHTVPEAECELCNLARPGDIPIYCYICRTSQPHIRDGNEEKCTVCGSHRAA